MSQEAQQFSGGEVAALSRTKKLASPVAMATPVLKIATFHSASLGALVAALPALVTLRDSFPGARIESYARAPLLPLLQHFSAVDETHVRPRGGLSAQAALMARLHGVGYDLALSFSQGSNALLLMWATGAPIRAGFVPSRMDALLTHKIAKSGALRPLDAIELARGVGAMPRGEKAHQWLRLAPEIEARAASLCEKAGIARDFLVISTQARKSSEPKADERGVDAAMIGELAQRFDLVLVGLKSSPALRREIGEAAHIVADLGGQTDVLTLAALCARSRGIFGIGNGVLQLGHFYEKPVASPRAGEDATRALQIFGF